MSDEDSHILFTSVDQSYSGILWLVPCSLFILSQIGPNTSGNFSTPDEINFENGELVGGGTGSLSLVGGSGKIASSMSF